METPKLIAINEFCLSHNIEVSFINLLQTNGLIEIVAINNVQFIHDTNLKELEKYVRFYYELDINLEGIESIVHLLQRLSSMQDEISLLKNRLRFYADN